jgi:molecular chaperone GrpE
VAEEKQHAEHVIQGGDQVEEVSTDETLESTEQSDEGPAVEADPLISLKKELEDSQNRYLRLQADFDNFRKRTRKEKEDWMKYASLPVIEALLPAIDNLERAIAASSELNNVESFIKGVDMVYRQINQVLEQEGLQAIEAIGQAFDPHLHQAVMQEESEDHESGIVLQELQKGYMLKDRVVRPAMVKVSS